MKNECVDAVFWAASGATKEAVLNSLVGNSVVGDAGTAGHERRTVIGEWVEALPVET